MYLTPQKYRKWNERYSKSTTNSVVFLILYFIRALAIHFYINGLGRQSKEFWFMIQQNKSKAKYFLQKYEYGYDKDHQTLILTKISTRQ